MQLLLTPITTATATTVSRTWQTGGVPSDMTLQATFAYGSGTGTADVWVQSAIGDAWFDVANFHFDTSSQRYLFNLSASTPVTSEYTPTDGTLASNTCVDGLLGSRWRLKTSSTGTYAGNTTLRLDAVSSHRLTALNDGTLKDFVGNALTSGSLSLGAPALLAA